MLVPGTFPFSTGLQLLVPTAPAADAGCDGITKCTPALLLLHEAPVSLLLHCCRCCSCTACPAETHLRVQLVGQALEVDGGGRNLLVACRQSTLRMSGTVQGCHYTCSPTPLLQLVWPPHQGTTALAHCPSKESYCQQASCVNDVHPCLYPPPHTHIQFLWHECW